MSGSQRLAFLGIAAVIAVAAVLYFALGSSDEGSEQSSATPTPTATATATPTKEPQEASPGESATPTATPRRRPRIPTLVPGVVRKLNAKQGDTVRFRAVSPKADEVHVHGYDILKDVAPGKPAVFSFKAKITGIFEVELEGAGMQIASLKVEP
jgi:hypothetical protein